MSLLQVQNLEVTYRDFTLHPLSFSLEPGEILSIIGESGSGKTTLIKAVACLMGSEGTVTGSVEFEGQELIHLSEKKRKKYRMTGFSVAFQNSVEYLNPSLRLRGHLTEIFRQKYPQEEWESRQNALLADVGLPGEALNLYPRELSGGMVQKFLLACAIALEPKLVLLDEPTSSLDSISNRDFVSLIRRLNRERGIAFLMATHDLAAASALSERMMVLYEGHIMEEGPTNTLFDRPRHPYTRGLFNASIGLNLAKDIWGIPAPREPFGREACPFCGRCHQAQEICTGKAPSLQELEDGRRVACHRGGIVKILEAREVGKAYGNRVILSHCSLDIYSGEVLALIGRSGAGKTTLARILSGFDEGPWQGTVYFDAVPADFSSLHKSKGGIQMIFQDVEASLDPHMTVWEAVSEPLILSHARPDAVQSSVNQALADVTLPGGSFLKKTVRSLSGGQKQRLSLARALTMEPRLLIADEPTSLLDPSSCANVLRLLKFLQYSRGFTMLIITHDLNSAVKISDSIYLLKDQKLTRILPSEYVSSSLEVLLQDPAPSDGPERSVQKR